jgi:putative transposase
MVVVKDLTKLTVRDLWREVKDEEDWWGELKGEVVRLVKRLLESAMEEEMVEQLRVSWYGRSRFRRGYRNGYRFRGLLTELGLVEHLKVPRDREGQYQPNVIERYQRRQERVNELLKDCFLGGLSTRQVGAVLAPVLGEAPSPQTVSNVLRELDQEVCRFHSRHIEDKYCYLILDGIVLKVKGVKGVMKRFVLCAYGITPDGEREMISFRQATAESEGQWEAFLRDLYNRGLEGKRLKLVVTDGCAGLHKALESVYPYVPRQRCWVHKLRNLASRLPRKIEDECLKGAKRVYQAENKREAARFFREWAWQWRSTQPRAVACLEEDLDELLNFMDTPKAHWRKVRTTNAIERTFREVRRRTRPMSCFQNLPSVDRIIFGVINRLNIAWKAKPIPEFTHYS